MQMPSSRTTQRISRPPVFTDPFEFATDAPNPCLATGRWHPVQISRPAFDVAEPSTEPVPMQAEEAAPARRWIDLDTVKILGLSLLLLAVVGGWLAP